MCENGNNLCLRKQCEILYLMDSLQMNGKSCKSKAEYMEKFVVRTNRIN